jgi:hypothetical protein
MFSFLQGYPLLKNTCFCFILFMALIYFLKLIRLKELGLFDYNSQDPLSENSLKYDTELEDAHGPTINRTLWAEISKKIRNTSKLVIMEQERDAGYGNRVYAFLNSFLLAFLTNGRLVINWENMHNYIQVNWTSVVFNVYQNEAYGKNKSKVYIFPDRTANSWVPKKEAATFYQDLPDSFDVYRVVSSSPVFFELLSNSKYFDLMVSSGLVSQRAVNNAKKLTSSSKNEEKVEALYQIGFEFSYFVLSEVWRPNKALQDEIDLIVRKQFTGFYMIGIQLRILYLKKDSDVNKLLECARNIESKKKTTQKTKWFISTDDEAYLAKLKLKYPGKIVTAQGEIAHTNSKKGYERTVIDNELLSKCDELIITVGSTFGFVAAMRMGRLPLFFNMIQNASTCERMSFTNYPIERGGFTVI